MAFAMNTCYIKRLNDDEKNSRDLQKMDEKKSDSFSLSLTMKSLSEITGKQTKYKLYCSLL